MTHHGFGMIAGAGFIATSFALRLGQTIRAHRLRGSEGSSIWSATGNWGQVTREYDCRKRCRWSERAKCFEPASARAGCFALPRGAARHRVSRCVLPLSASGARRYADATDVHRRRSMAMGVGFFWNFGSHERLRGLLTDTAFDALRVRVGSFECFANLWAVATRAT